MFSHPDAWINALGVLLTGFGAIVSAFLGYHSASKRHANDCDKRIKEIEKAIMLGISLEKRDDDDHEDRWSHLP
jgi:hypothetical protein